MRNETAEAFLGTGPDLLATSLLPLISEQAAEADTTRAISPAVIAAIKESPLMGMSATREIGGGEASMAAIGRELESIAGACGSTAWCLWNHLCVFHLFVGAVGPDHVDLLTGLVEAGEWVSFPGGAGTRVMGREQGDEIVLSGPAAFGSGSKYGEWLGVAFVMVDDDGEMRRPLDLRFTMARSDTPGVRIDETWDGMSLRASGTDTVHYESAHVPADRCVGWFGANRAGELRDPDLAVINHRYREDWVGISDIWLGSQAVGVARAALTEAVEEVTTRRAIIGIKMAERSTIQAHLGEAAAKIAAASATIAGVTNETDARIVAGQTPTDADLLRQLTMSSEAIGQCHDAMALMLQVLGGNGLREGGTFARRWRDIQAMPLHVNAHRDRVTEQLGKHLLGQPLDPF